MTLSPTTTTTTPRAEPDAAPQSLLAAWRWWLGPTLLALVLALFFIDPFIGDWDGLDYTVRSLRGDPSTMALGRILFIFFNHALWRLANSLFQLPADQAYLLFKYAVVVASLLTVVACWALARELTKSVHAATIVALLVTVSPIFVIYSGQVMTDVPSLLLTTIALVIHLRGLTSKRLWLVLAGAALLGAAVNLRETAGFYAPWLVIAPFVCGWQLRGRDLAWTLAATAVFLFMALAPFSLWYLMDIDGYRSHWHGWRESMRAEVARHPVDLRNLTTFFLYFFALSPLTVVAFPVAAWQEWRARKLSPLLLMGLVGVFANLLLFFNYSTVINWRYFLTALPAMAPLVSVYFMRSQSSMLRDPWRAFLSVAAGVVLIAIVCAIYLKPVSTEHIQKRALTRNYRTSLQLLPRDAAIIAGGQTIAVDYWRGIGAGEWPTIGTGSAWPGDNLIPTIEAYLNAGRRVFLDADPRWWSPCGWQKEETRAITAIESRFRFRRISQTIYEIRPLTDETAHDTPKLESLLPENRSYDVSKCPRLGKST